MTILAALIDEAGTLVVAADGKEWATDDVLHIALWKPVNKIMGVPAKDGISLAWGYTGRGEGDQLIDWFAAQDFNSWADVKLKLATKIYELNATPMDESQPELGPISEDHLSRINVLVVGFVNGIKGFFAMDPVGGTYPDIGNAIFVGLGADEVAAPGWQDAINGGEPPSRAKFAALLIRMLSDIPMLQFPLNLWEVTETGYILASQIFEEEVKARGHCDHKGAI